MPTYILYEDPEQLQRVAKNKLVWFVLKGVLLKEGIVPHI